MPMGGERVRERYSENRRREARVDDIFGRDEGGGVVVVVVAVGRVWKEEV